MHIQCPMSNLNGIRCLCLLCIAFCTMRPVSTYFVIGQSAFNSFFLSISFSFQNNLFQFTEHQSIKKTIDLRPTNDDVDVVGSVDYAVALYFQFNIRATADESIAGKWLETTTVMFSIFFFGFYSRHFAQQSLLAQHLYGSGFR